MCSNRLGFLPTTCKLVLIPVTLILLITACSNSASYEDAVELIIQKKYAEAETVLKSIPLGDSLASKAQMALLVCEIGKAYQEGRYQQALAMVDSTANGDNPELQIDQYFLLNYAPDDVLYAHVSSLAVVVACRAFIEYAEEFLQAEINEENNEKYESYNSDFAPRYPLDFYSDVTEGREREYREQDRLGEVSFLYYEIPFIRSTGLDRLKVAPEWKTEVEEVSEKVRSLKSRVESKCKDFDAFDLKHRGFSSEYEAYDWLLGTNGEKNTVWQATEWSESPRYGKMARMSFFFQRRGELVFQWDTFLTDREENVLNNGGTDIVEIESVDGNTINLRWASGTRVSWERVEENKFKFGSGTLVRTR